MNFLSLHNYSMFITTSSLFLRGCEQPTVARDIQLINHYTLGVNRYIDRKIDIYID